AIEDWYKQLPPVTRAYITLCVLTTAGCALEVITPFNIYFNARLIFQKGEVWRLLTTFMFFGSLGLDFVFHMFFIDQVQQVLWKKGLIQRQKRRLLVDAAHWWSSAHVLCPFCKYSVLGFLFDLHDGVCVGSAASVRQFELPRDIHIHSPVSTVGLVGIQCCAAQLACGRSDGHAGRSCVLFPRRCISSYGAWQTAAKNTRFCESAVPS
ncbi:MAG: derlin- -like isoform 2, partial [Trebouxia sp. A1-2]